MAEIGLRLNADTANAQGNFKALSGTIGELQEKLEDVTQAGNWKDAADITMAINNLSMAQNTLGKQLGGNSTSGGAGGANAQGAGNNVVNIADTIKNGMSQYARGDIANTVIGGVRSGGQSLRGVAKDIDKKDEGSKTAKLLGGLGVAGVALGALAQGAKALADEYNRATPSMVAFNRQFSPVSMKEAARALGRDLQSFATQEDKKLLNDKIIQMNSDREVANRKRIKDYATDSGVTNDEFEGMTVGEASFGKITKGEAITNAWKAGKLSYATGADFDLLQQVQGTARRYGDKNQDVLATAYGGLQSSGMGMGQFNEYLQALQRVMEDGIENGFLRTTDEVIENLNMFARLSDNDPFWQGKNGAQKMIQMSGALAGATSLQDTGDLVLFGIANNMLEGKSNSQRAKMTGMEEGAWTGTYIDTQLMLEHGITAPYMSEYGKTLDNMYGKDNVTGQIEEIKRDFDLNYTGSTQLYKILQNKASYSDKDFEEAIKAVTENADYASNEKQFLKAQNDTNANVVAMGKGMAEAINALKGLNNKWLEKIYGVMTKDNPFGRLGIYDKNEKKIPNELKKKLGEANAQDTETTYNNLQWLENLPGEVRDKINISDFLNVYSIEDFNQEIAKLKELYKDDPLLNNLEKKNRNLNDMAGKKQTSSFRDYFNSKEGKKEMSVYNANMGNLNDEQKKMMKDKSRDPLQYAELAYKNLEIAQQYGYKMKVDEAAMGTYEVPTYMIAQIANAKLAEEESKLGILPMGRDKSRKKDENYLYLDDALQDATIFSAFAKYSTSENSPDGVNMTEKDVHEFAKILADAINEAKKDAKGNIFANDSLVQALDVVLAKHLADVRITEK